MEALTALRWILLFSVLLAPAVSAEPLERRWQATERGDGRGFDYQVFRSQEKGEAFPRYEVRGRVSASPQALLQAMRTIVSDPTRAPKGQTRRVLQVSEEEFVVHTLIDLPPLFSDRDIVTRGTRSDAGEALRVDWSASEHPDAPPRKGVIRIERSGGYWSFAPGSDGGTEMIYATYVDVAGALPGWLVKPLTEGNVANIFEQVAEEAIQFAETARVTP